MKKITLLFLFCVVSGVGFSQSYEWAKKVAGTGSFNVTTSDVIAGGNGDVYVSGKFTGTVDFDPNATTVSKVAQGTDGFVAAYNPAGELEWVYTTDLAGNEEIPAISFYSPNGGYQLTAVIKIGTTSFKLVKLSRTVGGVAATSSTYSASASLDIKEIDDRGYLVGGFTGTFDLGTGASPLDLTNAGLSDGFCIKIGGTVTTYSITETQSYGGTGFDIIHSVSGEYLAGSFTGSIVLSGITLTSYGGKDGLLFEFDLTTLASSSSALVDKIGGTGDDEIYSIYYDPTTSGNFDIRTAGYFSDTANFRLDTGTNWTLVSAGGKDGFIANYSRNSNSWSGDGRNKFGGTGDDEIVDIGADNNVTTLVFYVGNVELASGGSEVLVGSYSTSTQAVTTYNGDFTPTDATKVTKASGVAFAVNRMFYVGEYNGTTDFNIDPAVTSNLTFTTGGSNMFLQKTSYCSVVATSPVIIGGAASCVGNSITMYIENSGGSTSFLNNNLNWKWYSASCGGTLVGTGSSITVSPTATTTYYARGEGGCVANGPCSTTAKTVTVYALPNSGVTLSGNTLSSSQVGNGASYQWVNCATGNSDIAGATSQTYTPTVNGNYAVKVSNPGGCLVTSACTSVTILSTDDFSKLNIKLYPNPVKNSFTIEGDTTIEKLVIYNLVGQQVKTFTNTNTYPIDDLTAGTYLVEVTTEKGTAHTKIVKE